MRQRTFTVFDDYIQPGSAVYTDARHNTTLAEHDMLGLHALADNPNTGGTVSLYVEHSSEGRNWLYRANNAPSPGSLPGTADLVLTMSAVGDFQHKMWSDACIGISNASLFVGPLLSFVRIRLVTSTLLGVHVKVHATLRGGSIGR
jgi:hypothetical protein